jgi:RsiW-degrading membrane proteinase PrsW (M82 family)
MDSPTPIKDQAPSIILQDVKGDSERAEHQPHDHDADVAHAWEHFRENLFFFGGLFLPVILLTVIAFSVDFGSWNKPVTYLLAALRSGLIAFFLSTLFKNFSFVFRTLFFTIFFLGGMIFLSLWDSEVHGIGDPIYNYKDPKSMQP